MGKGRGILAPRSGRGTPMAGRGTPDQFYCRDCAHFLIDIAPVAGASLDSRQFRLFGDICRMPMRPFWIYLPEPSRLLSPKLEYYSGIGIPHRRAKVATDETTTASLENFGPSDFVKSSCSLPGLGVAQVTHYC